MEDCEEATVKSLWTLLQPADEIADYISEQSETCCRTRFGGTYTKIGTIQRRLAWPLRKDDTQNREAFHIF